jgi:hypothetical protein
VFWEVFFGIEALDLVRRHRGKGAATRQAIFMLADLRIRHVPLSHLMPTPLARQNVAPRANFSPFHLQPSEGGGPWVSAAAVSSMNASTQMAAIAILGIAWVLIRDVLLALIAETRKDR